MKKPMRLFLRMLSCVLVAGMILPGLAMPVLCEDETQPAYDFSNKEVIKVACVGASTTEGTKGYSYPAFLQTMLGGRCEVRNFGVGGTSVVSGRQLSYFNMEKYTASLEYQADIVIIDIGGNDTQPGIWNGGNNTFAEDYEALILSYLQQDNQPLVMLSLGNHMHQFDPSQTFWGSDESVMVESIIPILEGLADKYDLPTAPLRETFIGHEEEYIDPDDGVHYTAAGYQAQAQLYYDTLQEWVVFPADRQQYLWKPTTVTFSNPYGTFDGYSVIQWVNGEKGYFQYDSGSLAAALGIESGTVVDNLTIAVSYYWDQHNGQNDCMHFNTNDKDGLSAPGIANGKEHDNGYGSFLQYGMKANQWDVLVVSRDEQMLGAPGAGDWRLNIGALAEGNSLYINGFAIYAALADGRVQSTYWGVSKTADRTALNEVIVQASAALNDGKAYTEATQTALATAKDTAIAVNRNTAADDTVITEATTALTAALDGLRYALGDINGNGEVTAEDALLALQAATEKVTLTATEQYAAGVDETEGVSASDALLILQHATKKITEF